MRVYPTAVGWFVITRNILGKQRIPTLIEDGNRKNSALCFQRQFQQGALSRDKGTDLFEYIVHRTRWDAVAREIDESYLLESIHDFVGRLPLLRERVCMSIFA